MSNQKKAESGKQTTEIKNSPAFLTVFDRVADERLRQRALFVAGQITFDVGSPLPDANRKLRVLAEEVGEVAEAIDFLEEKNCAGRREHLRTELIQVAAVAVAWLESLEVA
ncbi:MAG: hypothetical protein KGL39_44485 [Patescibacteria group bacterium]|nr:hypothetical protein [Patescibacteria group bacterium]